MSKCIRTNCSHKVFSKNPFARQKRLCKKHYLRTEKLIETPFFKLKCNSVCCKICGGINDTNITICSVCNFIKKLIKQVNEWKYVDLLLQQSGYQVLRDQSKLNDFINKMTLFFEKSNNIYRDKHFSALKLMLFYSKEQYFVIPQLPKYSGVFKNRTSSYRLKKSILNIKKNLPFSELNTFFSNIKNIFSLIENTKKEIIKSSKSFTWVECLPICTLIITQLLDQIDESSIKRFLAIKENKYSINLAVFYELLAIAIYTSSVCEDIEDLNGFIHLFEIEEEGDFHDKKHKVIDYINRKYILNIKDYSNTDDFQKFYKAFFDISENDILIKNMRIFSLQSYHS